MTTLPVSEADLQAAVLDLAALLGVWAWHDNDPRRNRAGLPDLLLVGNRLAYRELKSATGRLRPEQVDVLDRLQAAGVDVGVWRPEDLRTGRVLAEMRAIAKGRTEQ